MDFKNRKVAVFGMARSGISAIKLLCREGAVVTAANSGKPEEWSSYSEIREIVGANNCVDENFSSQMFAQQEYIILSPGIKREHNALKEALSKGIPVISEIELGFNFLKSEKIIAVTGSNGKTTTVSLLKEMIERSKHSVFLGGNIGIPLCDYILENRAVEYLVLELSSFQLESIVNFRSDVSIILNLFLNHGERYLGLVDYGRAKFNITNNALESDLLITPNSFDLINKFREKQICKKEIVDLNNLKKIKSEIEINYSLKDIKIVGNHNITNLYFAIKALENFGIKGEGVQEAIDSFEGVSHRVQYIKSCDSFMAYNDAKSTNFDALVTAINSMNEQQKDLYVIIGGKRRRDDDSIGPVIETLKKVKKVLLIGETTEDFSKELEGKIDAIKCFDLKSAINYARENSLNGILLFSPGFPSFDQYKNFEHRGEHFISLIRDR